MKPASFPFVNGSYNGRSPSFDAQKTLNFYVEATESGTSRSKAMLIGTPGCNPWLEMSGGGIRGMIVFDTSTAVVIAGGSVWKVTTAKVATLLGFVSDNTDTVSLASNGTVIMMVDGTTDGYFIDPTLETVVRISDPDFFGGTAVDYLDGYFIWNRPDTGQFQITELFGEAIDPLDFATAEAGPDDLVTLIVDHREAWLLGQNTTEVRYNSGNADFPIEPIQGAFLQVGCAAPRSVVKLDNTIFWLASDDRGLAGYHRAENWNSKRVSNDAFDFAIASYSRVDDAVAYSYQQEGHGFIVISFPTAGATWSLDVSNGLWHERPYRLSDGTLTRHRSNCQMYFAGLTIVGDWEIAQLYSLDLGYYTDNGAAILSMRRAPHLANGVDYAFHHSLQLTMQTGVGLTTGQGSDPQAMLRWSDDGGYAWSNERWASIGRLGERMARVMWRRLGKSRDRIYEVSITDPVRRVITDAFLDVSEGVA